MFEKVVIMKIHERRVHVAEKSFEKRKEKMGNGEAGNWGRRDGYRYIYEKDKNINGRRKGFS